MILISYIPILNEYLHTGPLSLMDWLYVMAGAIIYLGVFEVIKLITVKKITAIREK